MRLSRLDLTRYGHFTDRTIDFGPRVPGRPDLHVIYGPNESGKSTALAALLDLLFGIEVQSDYGFLHDYRSMEIRARLDTETGSREVVRVKRRTDSLVDPSGAPVDPGILANALRGLDRDGYRMMFSLDDATLEEGGDAILASRGDLGQVLFSATAGLNELHATITAIRTEADAFHKARSRSGDLASLKARLEELRKRRAEIDTVATQHSRLVAERSETRRAHETARDARIAAKAQATSVRNLIAALPHFVRIASARDELEGLASLPDAPPTWSGELPALQREEVEVATRLDDLRATIDGLEKRVEDIVVDEGALSVADEVERLPGLRTRHSDALDALPEVRARLAVEGEAIAGILRELDRPADTEAKALLLPAPMLAVLDDLTGRRSGVVEALRKASRDVEETEATVVGAREDLGGRPLEADPTEAAASGLVRSVANAARGGGHDALAASAARTVERRRARLSDAMLGLRPWEGDLDSLAAMVTPAPADVEAWRNEFAEATAAAAEATARVAVLEEDRARLRAEAAAGAALGSASDDTGAVRGDRERAWAVHRSTLDGASADAFEHAMRKDDAVTSARIGHVAELSRIRQFHEREHEASAAINRSVASRERALARTADVRARVGAAAKAAGGAWDGAATPAWLEGWLSRRSSVLDLGAELADAEAQARDASEAAGAARIDLTRVLAAAAVPHDPDAGVEHLTAAAQAFLDEQAELAGRRRRLADLERDLAGHRRSLAEAEVGDEDWWDEWERACAGCWIGPGSGLVQVRAILGTLNRLGPLIDGRDRLLGEERRFVRDAASFVEEVGRLARSIPHVDAGTSPSETSRRLEAAAGAAVAARDGLAAATAELEAARDRKKELVAVLAVLDARKGSMTSMLSVDTLAEVAERLASIARRRELRVRLERAELDLVEALGVSSLAEADALLRGLDRDGLKARLTEAETSLEECERIESDAHAAHRRAVDRVAEIGGDDEVARIAEDRSTILLEIEDRAAACLRLRMGVLAAEAAIALFRDEHKSGLMASASEAFAALTAGSYTRLTSRPERTGETLIAMTGAGGSKTASELSKGTRFQLYLALRIAAYGEYVRSRPSVPFVADDILETFDDQRSRKALSAFARMAGSGQVVYLTHHPHVCRLAASVCPGVTIHQLSTVPGA